MRPRTFALLIAAVTIAAMCVYKLSVSEERGATPVLPPLEKRLAPLFELYDQQKPQHVVRLKTNLGRQPILVVFYDGTQGVGKDPVLLRLREQYDRVEAGGALVLAISTALPQQNRATIAEVGEFPFPLLSDPGLDTHRQWGRVDEETGRPLTGVFFIDRAGYVASQDGVPEPLPDPDQMIDNLVTDP